MPGVLISLGQLFIDPGYRILLRSKHIGSEGQLISDVQMVCIGIIYGQIYLIPRNGIIPADICQALCMLPFCGMQDRIITGLFKSLCLAGNQHLLRPDDVGHGVSGHIRHTTHGLPHGILVSEGIDNRIADSGSLFLLIVEGVILIHEKTGLKEHDRNGDDQKEYGEYCSVFSDVGFH